MKKKPLYAIQKSSTDIGINDDFDRNQNQP